MSREPAKSAVAVYVRYYLSPSETFVYRQLKGISVAFHPIVLASRTSHLDLFPTGLVFARGKDFFGKVATRLYCRATGRYTAITPSQYSYWKRMLTLHGVRLVHAHFGHFGLDMLPVARSLGIPLLVTFHGFDASKLLRDERYTAQLRDLFAYAQVITVSRNMAERLAPFGLRDGGYTVHYIGVPVEEFEFMERPGPAERMRRGEPLTFLQISNFVEKKGHRCTIEAFGEYFRGRPDDRLILAGDGPLKPEIEALAASLGLRERVQFAGRAGNSRVRDLMRSADVFVHHSVTAADGDMEGIPTVIMEAMSTGLVVVSTRHSGIPELIDDGVDGFLVSERDVGAYVEKLRALSECDAGMGERARRKIEEKFNMSKQNLELRAVYRRAIDGGRI